MRSVVDRNVVMRGMTVLALPFVATVLDRQQASHLYNWSGSEGVGVGGKSAATLSTDLNNVKRVFC